MSKLSSLLRAVRNEYENEYDLKKKYSLPKTYNTVKKIGAFIRMMISNTF